MREWVDSMAAEWGGHGVVLSPVSVGQVGGLERAGAPVAWGGSAKFDRE